MGVQRPQRRAGAAWQDERASERGNQPVMQAFSAMRAERVMAEAVACAGCLAARTADAPDALCEAHLGEALGMHAAWDPP